MALATDLKQLRKFLREKDEYNVGLQVTGRFQVIGVFCYTADTTYLKSIRYAIPVSREVAHLFDLMITDGKYKLKCLLALPLGDLVQKNILRVGSTIQTNIVRMCFLESEAHVVSYICLEDLDVHNPAIIQFHDLDSLLFLPTYNERETEFTPLVTGRKCYLHPWFSSMPTGPEWSDPGSLNFYDNTNPPPTFQSLRTLGDEFRSLPRPFPPVLVVVLFRGKLHHYGISQNDWSYPFLGYLTIADSTASCQATIFLRKHVGLFYNIAPGTILVIERFVVQEKRTHFIPPVLGRDGDGSYLEVELLIGDSSRIQIVSETDDSLAPEISTLPRSHYCFYKRQNLRYLADDTLTDVVGFITYVSRIQRYKFYRTKGLHSCYWLEVVDNSCNLPFRIKIIMNRELIARIKKGRTKEKVSIHEELHPGQFVVLTQLRVAHIPPEYGYDLETSVYLVSSVHTEIFIRHSQTSLYMHHQVVAEVVSIIQDNLPEIGFLRSHVFRIGGACFYPPECKNLDHYREKVKDQLIPGAAWQNTVNSLFFREHSYSSFGGFIVKVEYVDLQTADTESFGWIYSSRIRARRTLFVDVRGIFRLRGAGPVNIMQNHTLAFCNQYTSENRETLHEWRLYPGSTADDWKPPNENDVLSIPVLCDGFYLVTIASLHYEAALECILKPEPAEQPYPSFMTLLSGDYQPQHWRDLGGFLNAPPRYTWAEVQEVQRTCHEVRDRSFVFVVELFKHKEGHCEALLKRAFPSPPEDLTENMAAEDVT